MDMQAVLKAGGVGAVVLIIFSLLNYIPCVGCFSLASTIVAYVGIGILAAHWMARPRTGSGGAINGAVAAIVAALIAGFVNLAISGLYYSITGISPVAHALADLPPEQLAALSEMGLDPGLVAGGASMAGVLGVGALCCSAGLVFAAVLGAAGGAYWGSSHPY